MDKKEKMLLTKEVLDIRRQNLEELWLFSEECLEIYLNSLINHGLSNQITKSVYDVWKNFYNILIQEKRILDFLCKKYKKIELSEVCLLLDELDALNELTYSYYNEILSAIKDASELNQPHRLVKPKKDFLTLSESDNYQLKAYCLMIDFEDIKKFFNYPEEFWEYVIPKVRIIDQNCDKCIEPQVIMKFDENNNLTDIRVMIPKIVDLKTALINVHEFQHAYDLYLLLGKKVEHDDEYYENKAKEKENEFQKKLIYAIN